MSDIAIRVNNLGKMYHIGSDLHKRDNIREFLSEVALAPFQKMRDLLHGQAYSATGLNEEIWALKNVSFEVKHGEVLGIIGPNGAGKSTLLKILSRITEPTSGYVDTYGRVGSLLEVGTGFHQELTGRENIYLNGAILGMARKEMDRKFTEIVDFSGISKFIDTPVKYFSSGMVLRLGFAVAAHLEPDILVVDEVLAVGDAAFQKKCLGKMGEVAGDGRTVLFVSHNMVAIQQLCTRGVLFQSGQMVYSGNVIDTTDKYMNTIASSTGEYSIDMSGKGDKIRFTRIVLKNNDGKKSNIIEAGCSMSIELDYEGYDGLLGHDLLVSIRIDNEYGYQLGTLSNEFSGDVITVQSSGTIICSIDSLPLVPAEYRVFLWCGRFGEEYLKVPDILRFTVVGNNYYGETRIPTASKHGNLIIKHQWGCT